MGYIEIILTICSPCFHTVAAENIVFPGEISACEFCASAMWFLEDSRRTGPISFRQTVKQQKGNVPFTIKASL